MKILKDLHNILKDWWQKSHQQWLDEQNRRKKQQADFLAFQIASALPGELAMAFRGRNYAGSVPIHGAEDFYFEKCFFQKGRLTFEFSIQKSIKCDLTASDLSLIRRQMNNDIFTFKETEIRQEGEEIFSSFFPCLYWGACVARVANSPRSERELLLYVI